MKKNILIIFVIIISFIGYFILNYRNNNYTLKKINYNGNNLKVSIDGEISNTLPTSGSYYLVDYDCKNPNTKVEWIKNSYKLNISNELKKSNVVCDLEFKSKPLLSEMPIGSYVAYIGNNGCSNTNTANGYTSCTGKNANYVDDTNMGYCNNTNYKFYVNGWRIGYIEDNGAYLVSAGATNCLCTNSDGTSSSSSCSSGVSNANLYKHLENVNNISLKYCNKDYAKGGVCVTNDSEEENNTTWAMNASDFKQITGNTLSSSTCSGKYSNKLCGYGNDLIDNGGYYWYATAYSSTSSNLFYWYPYYRGVNSAGSVSRIGVRPVLALDSSVFVTGGDGTYENPYTIGNYNFNIDDSAGKSNIELNLSGSDVSTMCISVDTSVCTNYITYSNSYTLDLSSESNGKHFIFVYYKDSNGNIVASIDKNIIIN